ncbi:AAA family ATPase [Rhodoblastus sp.]|uniref:AAA family ATPase n=1 Tax=Rhodoblastus sp. TaxID=1962975 RepID=UPI0035B44D5C
MRDLLQRCEGYEGECWYDEETRLSALAAMTATSQSRARARLHSDAPLGLYGLVQDCGRNEYSLTQIAQSVLRSPSSDSLALRRRLLGAHVRSALDWTDFDHIEGREIALGLVEAALTRKERGVNILFYGSPGTGKTELARAIGDRLGAHAVFAGEATAGAEEREPSRGERIGAIALMGVLARQAGGSFVVVDEADDVFANVDVDGAARKGSKAFTNRLVETSEAPTIWITNAPGRLGAAVLRRMSYVLRFPEADRTARSRMIDKLARHGRVKLADKSRDELAALNASPAILTHALRAARLAGVDPTACARASLRAIDGAEPEYAPAPIAFDVALIRADHDLLALRDRIASCGTLALSFCFHGVPGSGKSAYTRHLAERLGLDVVEKRASDLFSAWLGQTEKAIRHAFEEAADRRAFLIFDEADSLLAARTGAQHSWEVTQVNELLVAMERHMLPFACSTNAFENLDPASLRRFLFKVKFLAMGEDQVAAAFRLVFGEEAPRELRAFDTLTPGDFALVARKAKVMGRQDAATLAQWLMEEASAKPGARNRMGF